MDRTCDNCKFKHHSLDESPCSSCDDLYSNWGNPEDKDCITCKYQFNHRMDDVCFACKAFSNWTPKESEKKEDNMKNQCDNCKFRLTDFNDAPCSHCDDFYSEWKENTIVTNNTPIVTEDDDEFDRDLTEDPVETSKKQIVIEDDEWTKSHASNTQMIVQERGELYGEFEDNARITQFVERVFRECPAYEYAPDTHKEALHMIIQKLSRCFCGGSFSYDDHWVDISGYAERVVDYIRKDNHE